MAGICAPVCTLSTATTLATAMRVRASAPRRVLHATTPAPVDLVDVFPIILAARASPSDTEIGDLGVILHSIVLFGLFDAALGPFADTWKV